MPENPTESTFPLYLLDLQAQLEAQLGRLRVMQNAWDLRFTGTTFPAITRHLSEIVAMNGVIDGTCADAITEIERMSREPL
jgi:hypothetical protein